jgi:hypothetical protein
MNSLGCLCLCLIGFPQGTPPQAADPPKRPAIYTLPQIRSSYNESRSRIRSMKLEYELQGSSPQRRSEQRLHRVIAARGRDRYAEFIHVEPEFPEDLDIRQCRVYYTGETLDVFYPLALYFETSRKNVERSYADKVRVEFYYECSGWWPSDDDSPTSRHGTPPFPHEVLARPDCRVLPYQEQVDGSWCHIVQAADTEKLWFDPAIGFALRQRELYETKSGRPMVHYELSDFRENPPRTWMPWRLRRRIYAGALPKVADQSVESEADAIVRRLDVNLVPADLFRFKPPPGTVVQDRDSRMTWQVPGGLDFLDTAVEIARRRGAIYASARDEAFPKRKTATWAVLLTLTLFSITLAQAFRVLHGRWARP